MIGLRPMGPDDVEWLARWDEDEVVAAALGRRGADWYDWPVELSRDVPWREFLIAEEDGRPIGFMQLTDANADESHHWGEVEPGAWSLDIWIGSPADRGRGLGEQMMRAALRRVFDQHAASVALIDPKVDNHTAIAFFARLGFERVGVRPSIRPCCWRPRSRQRQRRDRRRPRRRRTATPCRAGRREAG